MILKDLQDRPNPGRFLQFFCDFSAKRSEGSGVGDFQGQNQWQGQGLSSQGISSVSFWQKSQIFGQLRNFFWAHFTRVIKSWAKVASPILQKSGILADLARLFCQGRPSALFCTFAKWRTFVSNLRQGLRSKDLRPCLKFDTKVRQKYF